MSDDHHAKIEAIWRDDRLGRVAEARLLVDYIESVSAQRVPREDARSFTLAVDVGYGEGKSFFLRRLAKHLALSHPVAFVDAWAEDTLDQPLTALAATLQKAFKPFEQDKQISSHVSTVLEKAGGVAKAVLGGAARRGAAYLISEAGVDAVGLALSGAPEDLASGGKAAAAVGDDAVEAIIRAYNGVAPGKLMQDRIDAFDEGRTAIAEMKESLGALVQSLNDHELKAPIVIVVDELDRCRPNYALKLLEEAKHLFDVPGVVFIFGMHGEQLAHAVSAAYGAKFAGEAYLRRFVSRIYRLKQPNLGEVVHEQLTRAGLANSKQLDQFFFTATTHQGSPDRMPLSDLVSRYTRMYGLPVRDVFPLIDALQTCVAVVPGQTLYVPLLLPLVISRIKTGSATELVEPVRSGDWFYVVFDDHRRPTYIPPADAAQELDRRFKLSIRDLGNASDNDVVSNSAWRMRSGTSGLGDPANYRELLEAVGRFSAS